MTDCPQKVALNAMQVTLKGKDNENDDCESKEKEPPRMRAL